MRIKLLHIKTNSNTISWNYGDDYADIIRHVVTDFSDFEECENLPYVEKFVEEFNRDHIRKGEYYLIAMEHSPISVKDAIQSIIDKERERERKRLIEEEKRRKRNEENAALKTEKRKQRLEKQLEKVRKELGEA
jgi:hypothetical protein